MTKNIFFPAKTGASPGYWSHQTFPYSRAVLQACENPRFREIVLAWGTQLGKTSNLGAFIAYVASENPVPILIATPDEQSAEEHQRTKLIPMLQMVSSLAKKVPPPRRRNKKYVDLGDQIIYYAWSGARWTVSGRSAGIVAVTEANLHTRDASAEGDPVEMARDRVKGFANYTIFIEGKPTETGACRVYRSLGQSDDRRYQLPCPHCKNYQVLVLGQKDTDYGIKWKYNTGREIIADSVYFLCSHCHEKIYDKHRPLMLARGQWVPAGLTCRPDGVLEGEQLRASDKAGFQLSSMYSPNIPWRDFAAKFVDSKRQGPDALKNFVQAWLAECYDVGGREVRDSDIDEHREEYPLGFVPSDKVIALVCTVDVQQDSLFYVVRAWGYQANSWLVRYGMLQSFSDLDTMLETVYEGVGNSRHKVQVCLIDSGDGNRTGQVYEYCYTRQPWCMPLKGQHQYRQSGLMILSKVPDIQLPLWNIDAGQVRDQFYERRLRIKRGDPGFWAIARDTGTDYISAMISWKRKEERDKHNVVKTRWVSLSQRYEHIADCEIYQEAAAYHFGFTYQMPPSDTKPVEIPERKRWDGRGWWER